MGIVYRATDTRSTATSRSRSCQRIWMHDPDRRRLFSPGGAGRLSCPLSYSNVAVIYDADEADGQTFIAMELIRGQKMSDWLAHEHLTVSGTLSSWPSRSRLASPGVYRSADVKHRDPVAGQHYGDQRWVTPRSSTFGIAKLVESAAKAADDRAQRFSRTRPPVSSWAR